MTGSGLRIGIFTDDFYPASGGVTRSIEQQIDQLAELGHQVMLFAPHHQFQPPTRASWRTVPHWRLPGTPSYLCSLQVSRRLAQRLAGDHPLDVVHSQNERGSLYLAAMVARAAGVGHVHTFHSNYVGTHRTTPISSGLNSLTYLPLTGSLLRLATRRSRTSRPRLPDSPDDGEDSRFARQDWRSLARLAGQVDAFTSPAPYMIDSITQADPALTGRGHVIASGVAPAFAAARRSRSEGPVRFLSCGRLGAEKRVDAIIAAFMKLDAPDTELLILGAGAEERSLRQQAGDDRRIRFLGQVNDPAVVASQIADADVFVLASYHFDTQGMVLAEAATAGTPVLYCDERLTIGVGSDNAVLTGPEVGDLTEGMRRLLDPALRERLRAGSGARRGTLGPEAMAQAYVEVYRQVSGGAGL